MTHPFKTLTLILNLILCYSLFPLQASQELNFEDIAPWAIGSLPQGDIHEDNLISNLMTELRDENRTQDTSIESSPHGISYDDEAKSYCHTFPFSPENTYQSVLKEILFLSLHITREEEGILGEVDQRNKVNDPRMWPYSSIGRIFWYQENYNETQSRIIDVGTGFITGPNKYVVTAGHCLFNLPNDNDMPLWFVTGITSEDGDPADGQINVFRTQSDGIRIHDMYQENQHNAAFDVGIFKPFEPIPEGFGSFGLYPISEDSLPINGTISGYPGEAREDTTARNMYTHSGEISLHGGDPRLLKYTIDTSSGQSGSAVYFMNNTIPYAIGIHTRNRFEEDGVWYNRGVRLTNDTINSDHRIFEWIGEQIQDLDTLAY